MDILLQTNATTRLPEWDFVVTNGLIRTVELEPETKQRAVVAAYLQRGTIPQLPSTGNPIVEMLSGSASPVELDASIRTNILDLSGSGLYGPTYTVEGNKVIIDIEGAV